MDFLLSHKLKKESIFQLLFKDKSLLNFSVTSFYLFALLPTDVDHTCYFYQSVSDAKMNYCCLVGLRIFKLSGLRYVKN